MYKPLEGYGITDEWLAEAPSISNLFGSQIAAVLAKLLLWAHFEPSCMEDAVAPDVKRAVAVGAFIQFNHQVSSNFVIPNRVNHIQRVKLIESESGGLVTLGELVMPNFGDAPDWAKQCDRRSKNRT